MAAELLRQLRERPVALLQAMIARFFSRALINTDAAPAHLKHHRQQINVETISLAGTFLIEDWV
jgi:hypothetical protein